MTTYVPGNPVYGDTLGRPEAWIGWAEAQGAKRMPDVRAYVETVYQYAPLIGIGGHKVVVQSIHETTEDGVPWASEAWTACVNPAGIGVTDDSKRTWHDFGDGRTAALAHLVHLSLYVLGEIPDVLAGFRDLDPRWRNVTAAIRGRRRTLASFGGSTPAEPTWAVDPLYGKKWADKLTALSPLFTTTKPSPPAPSSTHQGTTTMTTWSTVIPGLPGGPLTTNHPVFIHLIPASYTRQRPGIKASLPRRGVQHGTGNANSTARSEANYITGSVANSAQVSYHSSTDDRETGVMVPADEVTWQAADGGGPGNMCGFSNEMAENEAIWADPVRRYNMIDNAANFMGGIAAHLEIGTPEQHWTFNWADPNRHNCPNFLRNRSHNGRRAWDIYVDLWTAYKAEERARISGGPVVGKFKQGDRVKIVAGPDGYNRREGPGTSYAITGTFAGGTAGFTVIDGPRAGDGYLWYDLAGNGGTGFIVVDGLEIDTTPQPIPEPAPVYAKPLPIPALLGTDLKKNDTAPGIVTDEANKFVFVADVIEVTAKSLPVLQYAGAAAPKLRADLVKGDRFVGAWLVTAADGKDYYVGCEPDWWRIPYDGTKRVADAPLLPGSERA